MSRSRKPLRPERSRARLFNYDYRKGGLRHRRVSAAPIRSSASHRATLPENFNLFDEDSLALEKIRDVWLKRGLCTRPADRTPQKPLSRNCIDAPSSRNRSSSGSRRRLLVRT